MYKLNITSYWNKKNKIEGVSYTIFYPNIIETFLYLEEFLHEKEAKKCVFEIFNNNNICLEGIYRKE